MLKASMHACFIKQRADRQSQQCLMMMERLLRLWRVDGGTETISKIEEFAAFFFSPSFRSTDRLGQRARVNSLSALL